MAGGLPDLHPPFGPGLEAFAVWVAGSRMWVELDDPEGAEAIYRRLLDRTDPWDYHNRGAWCGLLLEQ